MSAFPATDPRDGEVLAARQVPREPWRNDQQWVRFSRHVCQKYRHRPGDSASLPVCLGTLAAKGHTAAQRAQAPCAVDDDSVFWSPEWQSLRSDAAGTRVAVVLARTTPDARGGQARTAAFPWACQRYPAGDQGGGPQGGHSQAGVSAHTAAHVRHASVAGARRPPSESAEAWPQRCANPDDRHPSHHIRPQTVPQSA
jgi:hypothetical protein